MIDINDIRNADNQIIMIGSHSGIIQSILDFDFLAGKKSPSIIAIIASGKKSERYFWGESEVVLPVLRSYKDMQSQLVASCTAVINVQSARRLLTSCKESVDNLPNLKIITVFADDTPELHSRELKRLSDEKNILIIGPSSVGLFLPSSLKLGAIAGTQCKQMMYDSYYAVGDNAFISTSGGMVNELITTACQNHVGISFALAIGGDRFQGLSPAEAILLAESDPATKRIIYFGELGGSDEYEIADLVKSGKIKKDIIAYIAGTISELFESPPQFGHAKALAKTTLETATAKRQALKAVGVKSCSTFAELVEHISHSPRLQADVTLGHIGERSKSLYVSHLSGEIDGETHLLGADLISTVQNNSVSSLYISMLLGQSIQSQKLIEFFDLTLRLLADHGPQVSGAMNTIVSARAGKDIISSVASGVLTIGPRFGGALNGAAQTWLQGVGSEANPQVFIDSYAGNGGIIPGIGHKKYSVNKPDPRFSLLAEYVGNSNGDRYYKFARKVERITTKKKGNLILNVDGVIAAIMLDLIESELEYDESKLKELIDIEFFNAIFLLSRTTGLIAHYLDQRKHDEGLLRLSSDEVRYLP